MKRPLLFAIVCLFGIQVNAQKKQPAGEFYSIIVYHYTSDSQSAGLDEYLKDAFLPAVHKMGFRNVGIFYPITNDTANDKRNYILLTSSSLEKLAHLPEALLNDSNYLRRGGAFLGAAWNQAPFYREETILLRSFRLAPRLMRPDLPGNKADHIYELRSYESPTPDLAENKIRMFNEGGEISLFRRLGFQAVFYARVLSGSRMPNLMYMTSFESREQRDAHWKTFGADPEWKHLSSLPEYQHNVSKADILLLCAKDYSDF